MMYKEPPHNIEAEQSVLGGLIIDNAKWEIVAGLVSQDDFYRQDHREVFEAIAILAFKRMPFDVTTIADTLEKQNGRNDNLQYVGTMAANTPSAANIEAYANIVLECSQQRQAISIYSEALESLYAKQPPIDVLGNATRQTDKIIQQETASKPLTDVLGDYLEELDIRANTDKCVFGVTTGLSALDSQGGLPDGLNVILARPSMGKTTFGTMILTHQAIKEQNHCLMITMEMPAKQIVNRIIANLANIHLAKLKSGNLSKKDWDNVTKATTQLSDERIIIDDRSGLNLTKIVNVIRKHRREKNISVAVIDYLQLIKPQHNLDLRQEIIEITRELHRLAIELSMPIVLLSQVNRNVDNRANRRPTMADGKESGSIEEDASLVMALYRDVVYDEGTMNPNLLEVIQLKHREDALIKILADADLAYNRINDWRGAIAQPQQAKGLM